MREKLTMVLIGVGALIMLLALGWVFQGQDYFLYKMFAPKYEAVRRQTFEQSKAYNQGMIQELQNMQLEYIKGTKSQKEAMASIILHRAADYDENRLPSDLKAFIQQLRADQKEIN